MSTSTPTLIAAGVTAAYLRDITRRPTTPPTHHRDESRSPGRDERRGRSRPSAPITRSHAGGRERGPRSRSIRRRDQRPGGGPVQAAGHRPG
jgi:hypothetical protein